ncbi:DUF805 domain-containing protein [Novosphingobium sp. FKTRR1]|uniref:DUF805 domain-containing protein n=1 Tax=unclassified Novosphingobium TaxID=2644732 RepID=UPI001CF056FD|nr:DUF805 domain-containing protein [Novosphingobium sp. FKTRR1]
MFDWMTSPYRRYADFAGRSRRKEYWSFALFYFLVMVVLNAAFGTNDYTSVRGAFVYGSRLVGPGNWLASGFWLVSLIPALAVSVRRLHDQDRSGWLLLLSLIPLLGWFALLVLMLLEGTNGPNRYGPDPKAPYDTGAFR